MSPGWAPKGPMQLLVAFFPGTQGGSQRKAGNGVLVGWLGPKGYGMEGAAGSVACCGAAAFPRLAFFSAVPPVPTGTRLGLPLIHRNTEVGALGLPPGCQQHPGLIAGTRDTPSIPGDQAGRGAQPPDRQAEGWGARRGAARVSRALFFFFSPEMVISSGPTRRGAEPLRHPVTDGRWRLCRRSRARSASRSSLLSLWLMIYFGRHPPRLVTWLGREKKK